MAMLNNQMVYLFIIPLIHHFENLLLRYLYLFIIPSLHIFMYLNYT